MAPMLGANGNRSRRAAGMTPKRSRWMVTRSMWELSDCIRSLASAIPGVSGLLNPGDQLDRGRPAALDDTTHPAECLDALHRESLEQMPIQTVALTKAQFLEVLARGEGHFLDFKSRETSASKLTKILSAFANADGGELYLGIADRGGT
jgi:hypothetical protein